MCLSAVAKRSAGRRKDVYKRQDLDNIIEADGAAALGEPVIGASDGLEAGAPGGSEVTEPIVRCV